MENIINEINKQNEFFNFILNSYNECVYDKLLVESTLRASKYLHEMMKYCSYIDNGLIKLIIDNKYEITIEEMKLICDSLFYYPININTIKYIIENIHKIKTKDFDLRDFNYETKIYELENDSEKFNYLKSNKYIKSIGRARHMPEHTSSGYTNHAFTVPARYYSTDIKISITFYHT